MSARWDVLHEIVSRLGSRATLYGDSRTVNEVMRDLLRLAEQAEKEGGKDAVPSDLTPLPVRWDRLVMQPAGEDANTIVCCITADTGQPVALFLDDEHREALGLQLLDPDAVMENGECPLCGKDRNPQTDQLAAYQAAVARALELMETAPGEHLGTVLRNIQAAADVLHGVHDTTGETALRCRRCGDIDGPFKGRADDLLCEGCINTGGAW